MITNGERLRLDKEHYTTLVSWDKFFGPGYSMSDNEQLVDGNKLKIDIHAFWFVPFKYAAKSWDWTTLAIKGTKRTKDFAEAKGSTPLKAQPPSATANTEGFVWVEYRMYCPTREASSEFVGATKSPDYPGRWHMRSFPADAELLWSIFDVEGQYDRLKVYDKFAGMDYISKRACLRSSQEKEELQGFVQSVDNLKKSLQDKKVQLLAKTGLPLPSQKATQV